MAFNFIHTADWQIGKPFGRFAGDVAARLRAVRIDCIDRLAEAARASGAAHVLVAGDVFDGEALDDAVLRLPLVRMAVYPDIVWHLLPGNHDPVRPGGVWGRLARLGCPANVRLHLAAVPTEIAAGVVLLPAPLAAKEMRTDPTQWMDTAATAEGQIRIGLAHGSVQGFGSLGEAAVPIEPSRRRTAGLDYLALGDWHGLKEIGAGVWYSGTPEPDSFADNGAGQALVVSIAAAGVAPLVAPVATAHFRWLGRRLVMSRLADLERIEDEIARLGVAQGRHLMALGLEGVVAAGEARALDERLAQLAAKLVALDVDHRRLQTVAGDDDVASLGDEVLEAVAGRIVAKAGQSATADERAAARALRLLLAYSADASAEAGAT